MIDGAETAEEAVRELFGPNTEIVGRERVGGGCIANGSCLRLSNGESVFVKQSGSLPADMFRAEADGLVALACDHGPRVPEPLAVGSRPGAGYIIMEWVEPGRPGRGFHETFGRRLGAMHRGLKADGFGFATDNYIGSTEQPNGWMGSWVEFFAERRIRFQTRLACDRGRLDDRTAKSIDSLISKIPELLMEPESPALLHGDLWGGNYLCDATGQPVLIDPAVYFGHREADLAMTELFGGFRPDFYAAYNEAYPPELGYDERRDLYNLYHLLNHLNIFGGGYAGSVRSIVARYR